MVLCKLPVPGCPIIWIIVGQGPIALAVDASGGGVCLDIFPLHYLFSCLYPSLWEMARYILKYYLPKTANQPNQLKLTCPAFIKMNHIFVDKRIKY